MMPISLFSARRSQKVAKHDTQSQLLGTKVVYRCNSWKRTHCSFKMFARHRPDGSFELYETGAHVHPVVPTRGYRRRDMASPRGKAGPRMKPVAVKKRGKLKMKKKASGKAKRDETPPLEPSSEACWMEVGSAMRIQAAECETSSSADGVECASEKRERHEEEIARARNGAICEGGERVQQVQTGNGDLSCSRPLWESRWDPTILPVSFISP
jgi:hypothetical protein